MRVGIAGAGMIVPTFLDAAALVKEMEIYAVFARKEEVRKEFCSKYQIPVGYASYEELLADSKVDVVYVALPNNLHFSFAKEALLAGKHVILEKPFTVTYEEAEKIAAIAREKKLYLFEAITNQYNPNYGKMKELLPRLGDIKLAALNFSQYSSRYDNFKKGIVSPSFDPKNAGGALMDLNIYNIHFVAGLFGKPFKVRYCPNVERGVDTSGILVMEYPDFQAVCIAAKDCGAPLSVSIQGNKGFFHSDYASSILAEFTFQENRCEPERYHLADSQERLFYELETFAKYYEEKDWDAFDKRLDHSLMVMEIVDQARRMENQGL
ncbi:scyllo-inositol 2-dehydrogenase (NADP(+)) IolU [Lachnospiraceae bacterium]|nr:scyllo-inositol 2-dehydrogenase (NADP(+)) IolU [Lachnospiraceae bacterium]